MEWAECYIKEEDNNAEKKAIDAKESSFGRSDSL